MAEGTPNAKRNPRAAAASQRTPGKSGATMRLFQEVRRGAAAQGSAPCIVCSLPCLFPFIDAAPCCSEGEREETPEEPDGREVRWREQLCIAGRRLLQ